MNSATFRFEVATADGVFFTNCEQCAQLGRPCGRDHRPGAGRGERIQAQPATSVNVPEQNTLEDMLRSLGGALMTDERDPCPHCGKPLATDEDGEMHRDDPRVSLYCWAREENGDVCSVLRWQVQGMRRARPEGAR